jgi:uncharacterized protein (UPF0276 family)
MNREQTGNQFYGVGAEWAEALEQPILDHLSELSLLELIPENFFGGRRDQCLARLAQVGIPVMVHSVELSIGTAEPLKQAHFDQVLRVADQVNTINLSDHLCFTEAGEVEIGQLTPLPWTLEAADAVCRKIELIQKRIRLPFLIENVTNRFVVPHAELTEPEFINLITGRTGCGLLIDMNNIHTNATNFRYDPYAWIDAIDLDAVRGVHIAGGHYDDEGCLVDSHSASAPRQVWDLYRYLCERVRPGCTIVEWTDDVPPVETLLSEVEVARSILDESIRGREARSTAREAVV